MRAAAFGKLDGGRPDPARRAGDQYPLTLQADPLQHPLRRRIGAGQGGQFGIRPVAADRQGVGGEGLGELGEGAVAFRSEGPGGERAAGRTGGLEGANQNPFADPAVGNAGADGDDVAAAIRALNPGEGEGRARPPGIVGIGPGIAGGGARRSVAPHRLGVPGRARVDVGVVHRRRPHPDQHLAGARCRHGKVFAPVQLVQAAMAGQQNAVHRVRDAHTPSPPQGFGRQSRSRRTAHGFRSASRPSS